MTDRSVVIAPPKSAPSIVQKAVWAAVSWVRRLSLTDPQGWQEGGGRTEAGESVTSTSVLGLSTAFACVALNAGTIGSLPFEVVKKNAKGIPEFAWDHPLNMVIRSQPNADETALGFWEFIQASLELEGNGYAEKLIGSGGRVIGLRSLDPGPMSVSRTDDGRRRYRWTERGISQSHLEDAILHVPGFGFGGSALKGISTLAAARETFGLGQAINKAARSTFANGMRPGHALTFQEFLKADQREIAERHLAEKFVGAIHAGRPMILEGGTKLEALSLSPEDAQMLESRKFSVEEICRFFQTPPVLIGHSNVTTWGTGVVEIVRGWSVLALRKRVKRVEQAATIQLLSREDRAAGYSISVNMEALLRADPEKRATFYKEMTQIGAMTINEVRAKEGLGPIPGGDVARVQMQNQPIVMGTPAQEVNPTPVPGPGDEG